MGVKSRLKERIVQLIGGAVRRELQAQSRNIALAQARRLAEEAAAFVDEHMGLAVGYARKYDLLAAALREVNPALDGIYCEFGVYQGKSINAIAAHTAAEIHGFDSFEGLPEDWRPGLMRGHFKTGTLPAVRSNVRLHKGWLEETLPRFAQEHSGPLAFAHVDVDLYSSTKTIFDVLGSWIVPGTVLQFDEFFNYQGWRQGEFRAFQEFCERRQVEVRYIGYTTAHGPSQVALAVTQVGA